MDNDDKKSDNAGEKKLTLVIRRVTVSALKVQAGVRTGGTCDNACASPVPMPQLPSLGPCPSGRTHLVE